MRKLLLGIDRVLAIFLMLLMAAIVIDVSWQVLSRFIVGKPSSFTEEVARFLLIWIGILGAAYAFRTHAHLGLDLITNKLPFEKRVRADLVVQLICFAFAASVMVYGGINLVHLQLELGQTSAALQIKMGYIYLVIPLAGLLICIYAIDNIFNSRERLKQAPHSDSLN
jgi:TRAP-type C4-dicarboxylate transport system permease small subunit